jgi:hypothetical protein
MTNGAAARHEPLLSGRAVFWSGLAAGLVTILLMTALMPADTGVGPSGLARFAAAILLGPGVLPPPATVDIAVILVATLVHFALSFAFAALIGVAVHHVSIVTALLIGGVAGALLYFINLYGFVFMFPWFALARSEASFLTHVVFGLVLAYVYKKAQPAH